ncbi:MAG: hypothetical protein QOD30_815 [Actinomycetota bacterium]|jgi:cytochrome P450|nr:hypothetical protein [Actinomycetota bacterium]
MTINFFDPEFLADPYPTFAKLRSEGAVHHDDSMGLWWTIEHDGMAELLRSPRFAKDPRKANPGPYTSVLVGHGEPSMLFMDDPDHSRVRGLVSKAFSRTTVAAMEPRIQDLCDGLLDEIEASEPFDLVSSFSVPFPIYVIAEMLGIDPTDRAQFKQWSEDAALSFDPFVPPDVAERVVRSAIELAEYLSGVVAQRRRARRNDLISALVDVQETDGARLSDAELVSVLGLLLAAGNITTTDLIGNGTLALLTHRAQWEKLCEQPSVVENAVEEMLRFDSPVVLTDRITQHEERIGGCPVPHGEWVWPALGAANRDPAEHPDPDRFDIERADTDHLSFGGGPHLCLGAPLARLEARVAFSTLARRLPTLRLARPDEPPVRKLVPGFRGVRELWLVAP